MSVEFSPIQCNAGLIPYKGQLRHHLQCHNRLRRGQIVCDQCTSYCQICEKDGIKKPSARSCGYDLPDASVVCLDHHQSHRCSVMGCRRIYTFKCPKCYKQLCLNHIERGCEHHQITAWKPPC